MDMDRPRALACRCLGIGQSLVDEYRRAAQPGHLVQLINVKFVLTLDRGEDPWLGRVKVEMSRTETKTLAGRDRRQIPQFSMVESKCLYCTGILRFARRGIIAARDEND